MKGNIAVLTIAACLLPLAQAAAQSTAESPAQDTSALKSLSLEELLDLRVTSVSKRSERLSEAPASIFVITAQDIQRSGASTLPEALRLAPNLQVARVDSVQYAISARGFNNAVGNKLLVLIDGRTVYTPLFSGVFWDQQDVMLEDVDRIEVISGPGATLWGLNAVNGVINVITRSAAETTGGLLAVAAGDDERGASARFGREFGSGAFRIYGKYSEWDRTRRTTGVPLLDEWSRAQAGFRLDWESGAGAFTLQGDAYEGESLDRGSIGPFVLGEISVSGANVLGRWRRELAGGSHLQVQTYFDRSVRDDAILFRPEADIFDIELQQAIPLRGHQLLWGGGYRHGKDDVDPGIIFSFIPPSRSLEWGNLFVQDEFDVRENLRATLGLKLEHNDYTGLEYLPNARLAWKIGDDRLLWGALSRAVRAPARLDRDLRSPGAPPFISIGGPNFRSEVANVAELGYRAQHAATFGYSITAFAHEWDRLRSGTTIPVEAQNRIEGTLYGAEAWATWQPAGFVVLHAGVTWLQDDLRLEPGSTDPAGPRNETLRNDPEYQWMLRSSFTLPLDLQLELHLRSVSSLPAPAVPAYTGLDARLTWLLAGNLELSVIGRNLLDEHHVEFGAPANRSRIERSFNGQVRWRF